MQVLKFNLVDRLVEIIKRATCKITKADKLRLEKLEKKLFGQKRFMNMVVHDLRNPSESIYQGMKMVQERLEAMIKDELQSLSKTVNKQ